MNTQIFVLWLIGAGFLIVETFAPGAVIGIMGAIACTVAVVLAFIYSTAVFGVVLMIMSVILGVGVAWFAYRSLGLQHELDVEAGFVAADDFSHLIGQTGEAITVLRPAGFARLGGKRVDVVTAGEHLPVGTLVTVTAVEGNKVEVRKA